MVSCDPWFASLFGYPNTVAVMGQSIFTLIPSLSLPQTLQNMTDQVTLTTAVHWLLQWNLHNNDTLGPSVSYYIEWSMSKCVLY